MGNRSQRKSDRLFSNSTKLSFIIGFVAIWLFFSTAFEPSNESREPQAASPRPAASTAQDKDVANPTVRAQSEAPTPALSEPVKKEIEDLFADVQKNPDSKERRLRQLRRILHETFAGQEDCWSCEGVVYFDRFDKIAGAGEARKPIGFREWLQDGDEAFASQNLVDARKFYSRALQVMDERSQEEDTIDPSEVDRLRNRCQELGCR